MTSLVQLRVPTITDAQSIALLSSELGYEVSMEIIAARIATLLGHSDHGLMVAEVSNELAGWIQIHAYESIESGYRAEIVGLVVGFKFRRNGIGRLLVEDAIRWSRCRKAEALVVRSNVVRRESHQFYPSVGFELTKTQAVYRMRLK